MKSEKKKVGVIVSNIKDKIYDIISKYEEKLSSYGIKIIVSKRYFETDAQERGSIHYDSTVRLLDNIDHYFDKKREQKHYKYRRNSYHCIILKLCAVDNKLSNTKNNKEYAFVLSKIERAHIGDAPEKVECAERKVLRKIEKRIQKITRIADKHPQKVCLNTWKDAVRYIFSRKYQYKKQIFGKERFVWDLIISAVVLGIVLVNVLVLWLIGNI